MTKSKGIMRRPVGLLIMLLAGLLVGVAVVVAEEASKVAPNPDVGLSDADRTKIIGQLKDRNAKWVQDFVDQGRDPRMLPVVDLPTYSAGATSLDEARSQSEVVIVGTVVSAVYESDPNDLTESVATVQVKSVVKGAAPATIEVRQVGGPAWSPDGGELQQLEGDPLLLPGQDVVLLLRPGPAAASYQTVYGAGVYLITPAGVKAPDSNAFAASVNGLSLDAALALLQ